MQRRGVTYKKPTLFLVTALTQIDNDYFALTTSSVN